MADGNVGSSQLIVGLCVGSSTDLRCTNNYEDNSFGVDTPLDSIQNGRFGKIEVDVTGCTDNNVNLENEDDPDATGYSSSFGGTVSRSDEVHGSNGSDVEVDSQYRGETEASMLFDGDSRLFPIRKKRLTAQWRRYVHSLSWRCKWVELRLHDLQSQARKYERALMTSANKKHPKSAEVEVDNAASRCLPLSSQSQNKRIMKRQKRNRMEDAIDTISYMSNHNLFAYYEKKKFENDVSVEDDGANQVVPVEPTRFCDDDIGVNIEEASYAFRDDDSLEQVLWTIELLQSRVGNLKTDLDDVVSKYSGKILPMEALDHIVQDEVLTSPARSATISPENGLEIPVAFVSTPPHHMSINEHAEVEIIASAVSSYGDATPHPDIIENAGGLLSGGDGSLDQSQVGDSYEDTKDEVKLNSPYRERVENLGKISKPPERKGKELLKNGSSSQTLSIRERMKRLPGGSGLDKPILRVCYRRKRGERARAVASSRWKSIRVSNRRRFMKKRYDL